jgi:cell division protein FtsW
VGLGRGRSQKFVIYAGQSDGIFAIIAEDGFVGALFVWSLRGLFACRALRIALHAPDNFGRLLAVG